MDVGLALLCAGYWIRGTWIWIRWIRCEQFGQHDDITVLTLTFTTPSLKAALA
jgi:hypothetical protein